MQPNGTVQKVIIQQAGVSPGANGGPGHAYDVVSLGDGQLLRAVPEEWLTAIVDRSGVSGRVQTPVSAENSSYAAKDAQAASTIDRESPPVRPPPARRTSWNTKVDVGAGLANQYSGAVGENRKRGSQAKIVPSVDQAHNGKLVAPGKPSNADRATSAKVAPSPSVSPSTSPGTRSRKRVVSADLQAQMQSAAPMSSKERRKQLKALKRLRKMKKKVQASGGT